jgi:hypothetical protein
MPPIMSGEPGAAKGVAALFAGLATLPWNQIALAIAVIYNLHLLAGWYWDRFLREYLIRKGWYIPPVKPKRRQRTNPPEEESDTDAAPLRGR